LAPAPPSAPESDLGELTAQFAAHGGGNLPAQLSADLALEVVLNEIVEQAVLATGATGAAIVLKRNGELVCRATAGANAPDLGMRLDGERGLSGACVQTKEIQHCDDAQSDPRADMEASRRLGIRSVMIVPLLRGDELLGVFEIFSARPYAFGDRDAGTLQALAQRALRNLQQASRTQFTPTPNPPPAEKIPQPPPPPRPAEARRAPATAPPKLRGASARTYAAARAPYRPARTDEGRRDGRENGPQKNGPQGRKIDGVILALSAAVFVCAVLLSTLLGLHFGRQKAADDYARAEQARTQARIKAKTQTAAGSANGPAGPSVVVAASAAASAASAGDPPGAAQPPVSAAAESASTQTATEQNLPKAPPAPAGSLLIYDNGKEVFRMPPSGPRHSAAAGKVEPASSLEPTVELSQDDAEGRLLHRVPPQYPEAALRQGIHGPVVLDLRIARDGAVQDVGLVSGQALLAQAAQAAVQQWQFKPQYIDGRAVETQTRITLRFRLPASR
jgi:TonB family protein